MIDRLDFPGYPLTPGLWAPCILPLRHIAESDEMQVIIPAVFASMIDDLRHIAESDHGRLEI